MPLPHSPAVRAAIREMWQAGEHMDVIMKKLGVSATSVNLYGGKRGPGNKRKSTVHDHDPEPVCFVSRCGKKPAKDSKFCETHKTPALRSREPLARLMAGR